MSEPLAVIRSQRTALVELRRRREEAIRERDEARAEAADLRRRMPGPPMTAQEAVWSLDVSVWRRRLARRIRGLRQERDELSARNDRYSAELRMTDRELDAAIGERDELRLALEPLLDDAGMLGEASSRCRFCFRENLEDRRVLHFPECVVLRRDELLGRV